MATQCSDCNGKGTVQVERHHNIEDNPGGKEYEEQTCSTCNGQGWVDADTRS
ncbi:hypothetical protein ACH427_04295 [Streptomyces sp. NPDC020379]|uniref:hypothetical protein n=1 Tax=Streptomyces sp. NPDC020379 TaxID=3365071 RepID=UPI0037AC94FE